MRPDLRGITAATLHEACRRGPLQGSPMLSCLRPDELHRLMPITRWVRFGRDHSLTLRGSRPRRCWLLLTGYVKEHRPMEDGCGAVSGFRGPGDLIGEVAAITGDPSEGDVTTLGPGEALAFDVADLRLLARSEPGVQGALLVALAERATMAETALVRNEVSDSSQRLTLAILDLADRWGVETASGIRIGIPLTQTELAEWVGASRETAAKALHRLRQAGLVETARRRLVIRDIEGLRAVALHRPERQLASA